MNLVYTESSSEIIFKTQKCVNLDLLVRIIKQHHESIEEFNEIH